MSFTVTRQATIDMGHALADHEGQCHHLHGHTYRVEVTCFGDVVVRDGQSDRGMVLDFAVVKSAIETAIVLPYDHRFIMENTDPRAPMVKAAEPDLLLVGHPPTAELLAARWAREVQAVLDGALSGRSALVIAVTVWETPNCRATWAVE